MVVKQKNDPIQTLKNMGTILAALSLLVGGWYSIQGDMRELQRMVRDLQADCQKVSNDFSVHCRRGPNGLPHAESSSPYFLELKARLEYLEKQLQAVK